MIIQVKKEEWKEFFDNLSRDLDGWESRVEIYSTEVGAQVIAEGLPFHGLTVEQKADGNFVIELSIGEGTESHQTHTIAEPTKVAFESAAVGPGGILDIEDASGTKLLIKFIQPFPVLVEYQQTELVAVASSGE